MKEGYRKKMDMPRKAVLFFVLLALWWHIPLLFISDKDIVARSATTAVIPRSFLVLQPPPQLTLQKKFPWSDPTVYLLPSSIGFSINPRRTIGSLEVLMENRAPPSVVLAYQRERREGSVLSVETLMDTKPSSDGVDVRPTAPRIPETASEEGSAWRLSGSIVGRLASTKSALPVVPSSELLGATVLHVGVTPQGDAQFVVLKLSSGSDGADEAAVRFVKGIRFTPVDPGTEGSTMWGIAKVLWRAERSIIKP